MTLPGLGYKKFMTSVSLALSGWLLLVLCDGGWLSWGELPYGKELRKTSGQQPERN